MKAVRNHAREARADDEEAAAQVPTRQQGGSFPDFFMEAVTGACEGDLDSIHKDEQLTDSSVAQLVGCLEAGADVFSDLEQQACRRLLKPGER